MSIAALNLASQPFRNRVLPWTVTSIVAFVALVALVVVLGSSRATTREAEAANAELKDLRERTRDIRLRAEALRQEMPANDRLALDAAHELVDRKGFSWSRLFADLEAAVPQGVRVTRIGVGDVVESAPDLRLAELNVTVIGRVPADVTGMIAEMNRGGVFAATPLTQEASQGDGTIGTEWTLRLGYRPRPGRALDAQPNAASVARAPGAEAGGTEGETR